MKSSIGQRWAEKVCLKVCVHYRICRLCKQGFTYMLTCPKFCKEKQLIRDSENKRKEESILKQLNKSDFEDVFDYAALSDDKDVSEAKADEIEANWKYD